MSSTSRAPNAVVRAFAECWRAIRYLVIGGGTALLAMIGIIGVVSMVAFSAIGVGLPAVPEAARLLHRLTNLDRRRAAELTGTPIPEPHHPLTGSLGERIRTVVTDPATRRDVVWLLLHGPLGLILLALAIGLPLGGLNQLAIPAYWRLVPGGVPGALDFQVDSWAKAWASVLIGLTYLGMTLLLPAAARGHARLARKLLRPATGVRLSDRVAELTASRAAALDAHGAELRRIERDLHDGTQARIAAVIMQLGIAEQLRGRDPDAAFGLVRKAQDTAMDALAELRDVVRGIYPPILSDRGLDGAVTALAARSPIPCLLALGKVGRRPAAVEAAAYFIIAEALANATKHSGAEQVTVGLDATGDTLVITVGDDGRGGADEALGSGLAGIRRRVDAFDGRTELTSPVGGPTRLRVELPCGS
ncbi:sensor histidine kinase [Actinokineospora enzanensis]|uniref:sensor histidine kinase n=1 Tax=Actinokineospora enzanensis TaxID=155975 RepID=UPI0003694675|nr:sensor histidine kinase [Actinokineospora enzanensis]